MPEWVRDTEGSEIPFSGIIRFEGEPVGCWKQGALGLLNFKRAPAPGDPWNTSWIRPSLEGALVGMVPGGFGVLGPNRG